MSFLESIISFDSWIISSVTKLHNPITDVFMKFCTSLGNVGILWIALAIIFLIIPKVRSCGVAISFALLLSLIIGNCILKPLIARPRPFTLDPNIVLLIKAPTDFSFPSGHTYSAFATAFAIYNYNKIWGIATYVMAFLIAFSRIYLQVHFLSDVLVGIIVGFICGFIGVCIRDKVLKKIHSKE